MNIESSGTKARISVEHSVEYPNSIRVRPGERVDIGREDEEYPGWVWCLAADGREGWMPVELLSGRDGSATVLEDYSAQELAVKPGEEVEIEQVRHGWALVRNSRGERGWIPEENMDRRKP